MGLNTSYYISSVLSLLQKNIQQKIMAHNAIFIQINMMYMYLHNNK